jgi:hypothetical protein
MTVRIAYRLFMGSLMEAYSVSEATLTLSRVSATDILYRPLQFQVHIKLYPSSGPYSRTKPVDSLVLYSSLNGPPAKGLAFPNGHCGCGRDNIRITKTGSDTECTLKCRVGHVRINRARLHGSIGSRATVSSTV